MRQCCISVAAVHEAHWHAATGVTNFFIRSVIMIIGPTSFHNR